MKRFLSFLSAALGALVLLVNLVPASAATGNSSSGLSITPRKNYAINAGNSVTDKLIIGNLSGSADLNVTLKLIDFTFTDQSGTPKLLIADNAPTTTWSLKPFTTLPQTIAIPAGSSKTVNFSIAIPKDLGAGSYYSAIEYVSGTGAGGNVNLNASGVSLVFVSVPGVVDEKLTLKKFGAYHSIDNGVTGSYQYIATSKAPRIMAYTLENSGNVAESPTGTVTIKNIFGHQVSTIKNVNVNAALALRGQTRLFTTCIKSVQKTVDFNTQSIPTTTCTDSNLKPGYYSASLDIFYGQNGNQTQEVVGTAHFWYLPWWLIIGVLVAILIIVLAIRRLIKKIKNIGKKTINRR